jgi:hypothetical protein
VKRCVEAVENGAETESDGTPKNEIRMWRNGDRTQGEKNTVELQEVG